MHCNTKFLEIHPYTRYVDDYSYIYMSVILHFYLRAWRFPHKRDDSFAVHIVCGISARGKKVLARQRIVMANTAMKITMETGRLRVLNEDAVQAEQSLTK